MRTSSDRRHLSRFPASSAKAVPAARFRTTMTQSTAVLLGWSSRQATRICRFSRFRSTAVPTALGTTRPRRARLRASSCPTEGATSRLHTCTTNPPAPRLRPSRSTRRNSPGLVSFSGDSRRCGLARATRRGVPGLFAGDARSPRGPPESASGCGNRGSSCDDVCLAEKFASRITSKSPAGTGRSRRFWSQRAGRQSVQLPTLTPSSRSVGTGAHGPSRSCGPGIVVHIIALGIDRGF
jgi:hypothetical protein